MVEVFHAEGFLAGADLALENLVIVRGSPISGRRKFRGGVFFCGTLHSGWEDFLEISGGAGNEKDAQEVPEEYFLWSIAFDSKVRLACSRLAGRR